MLLLPDLDTTTNLAPLMLPSFPIINSSAFPNRYWLLGKRLSSHIKTMSPTINFSLIFFISDVNAAVSVHLNRMI